MRKIRKSNKLIYGVGVNDSNYTIEYVDLISGKRKKCIYYKKWVGMLERCYSDKLKIKHPTYTDCIVCDEWLYFMTFRSWMQTQDWKGKELDKDILIEGNKRYSPETCVFVDRKVNTFILDCGASRCDLPIGVSIHAKSGKYQAQCNRIIGKSKYLGLFENANEAHYAWLKAKNEEALRLSALQNDPRVANVLLNKYKEV